MPCTSKSKLYPVHPGKHPQFSEHARYFDGAPSVIVAAMHEKAIVPARTNKLKPFLRSTTDPAAHVQIKRVGLWVGWVASPKDERSGGTCGGFSVFGVSLGILILFE